MALNFSLVIGRSWPPSTRSILDPIDRLSPWEAGIQRFLYEKNRIVHLRAKEYETALFFIPDVRGEIAWIPDSIRDVREGRVAHLDFPASNLFLTLRPDGRGSVTIDLREGSLGSRETTFHVPMQELVDELIVFVATLTEEAVAGGYVTQADADKFLAPIIS